MAKDAKEKKGMNEKASRPPQSQSVQPGITTKMDPEPADGMERYRASGRFAGKVAIVTGGDSGIGRAASIGFAKEGAKVAVIYLDEDDDAAETKRRIEAAGGEALLISGDIGDESFCIEAVEEVMKRFGRIDVLVNNAGEQHVQESILDISEAQLVRTFRTNIFGMFFMAKACLPFMNAGSAIVNTASITAYEGNKKLIDYSSTKGAIVSFTRSLAQSLADIGIRVNAVAPGPIWTPLIPASFPPEKVETFGLDVPMERPGEPDEVAPAIIFLASDDASYISGQTIHVNGGVAVNG